MSLSDTEIAQIREVIQRAADALPRCQKALVDAFARSNLFLERLRIQDDVIDAMHVQLATRETIIERLHDLIERAESDDLLHKADIIIKEATTHA